MLTIGFLSIYDQASGERRVVPLRFFAVSLQPAAKSPIEVAITLTSILRAFAEQAYSLLQVGLPVRSMRQLVE